LEVRIKNLKLLLCQLAIALLLGSFLWSPTHALWQTLDTAVFKFLNRTLEGHPWIQIFWAFVNHRKTDLVEDAVFLLFLILGVRAAPKGQRIRRTAQFIFCIILAGSIIHFVNRTYLKHHVLIPRESPSLVITPCIRLSDEVPWMIVKDETVASFPGDHATTLFLFAGLYTFFAGRKLGKYACLYTLFRLLPRLIVGAHWLSDIVVGSGSIALFFLSWTLFTPFHRFVIDRLEKFLNLWKHYETKKDLV
jgi:membrane-associated phospholipid phosphatase